MKMSALNSHFVLSLFPKMNSLVELTGAFVSTSVRMIDAGPHALTLKVIEVRPVAFSPYGARLIRVEFPGVVMLIVCV